MDGSRHVNGLTENEWFVAAASVAGTKHIKRNAPNQDALYYRTLPGTDWLVAVVCDGASSASEGRKGAQTAASATLESTWQKMAENPDRNLAELLSCTVEEARKTVVEVAEESGIPLREYATTLTVFAQLDGRAAAAQIGDGTCVVGTEAGWKMISEPQRGEYANQTYFITEADAVCRMSVSEEVVGVQRVMLCTDGMMSLTIKQPSNEPHTPYFNGTFAWLEQNLSQEKAFNQLQRLLRSSRVTRRTDDDLTMFQATLLHRTPEPAERSEEPQSETKEDPKPEQDQSVKSSVDGKEFEDAAASKA